MPGRVLLLSASIGTGHLRAADAIERALRIEDPNIELRHEDALDFANHAFRKIYQESYVNLVNKAPQLLGFMYDFADKAFANQDHGLAFERWNSTGLINLVKSYKPDVVVCTHPLPADMVSWLTCKGSFFAQHAIVITDFDIHPLWLCHHYSTYFVAIDEIQEHMAQLGYERDRLKVTGIPVDPVFAEQKDKTAMRKKLGLDPDCLTLLIAIGGLGMGPMEEFLLALKQLKTKVQIVAICGANEELKNAAMAAGKEIEKSTGNKVYCVGYVKNMDEYMAASDLLVGKSGGLTSSEALCKGLAFVIVSPIPGQEERNADHLLEEWTAIRCNNIPALAFKIDKLISDPARLKVMKENALRMSRPNAARDIAREVLSMLSTPLILSTHPVEHQCN